MDRVFLLYIRSRPVPDFHWLKIAACSLGVNELIIKLIQKTFYFYAQLFRLFSLSIIEHLFYNVKCYFSSFDTNLCLNGISRRSGLKMRYARWCCSIVGAVTYVLVTAPILYTCRSSGIPVLLIL